MSNYTKATNFLAKDSLASGNPLKVVRGAEIDAEFEAIETAVASKANSADVYTSASADAAIEAAISTIEAVSGYSAGTAPGKMVVVSAGFTVNTGLAANSVFSIYNDSTSAVTITQGAGLTLRLAGSAGTGNRTVAARGMATVWAKSTTEYIISGPGVY